MLSYQAKIAKEIIKCNCQGNLFPFYSRKKKKKELVQFKLSRNPGKFSYFCGFHVARKEVYVSMKKKGKFEVCRSRRGQVAR